MGTQFKPAEACERVLDGSGGGFGAVFVPDLLSQAGGGQCVGGRAQERFELGGDRAIRR